MASRAALACAALLMLMPSLAMAQDRPFAFTIATSTPETPEVVVHYDAGIGERAFDVIDGGRLEQRIGVHAWLGRGLTLLARVGVSTDGSGSRGSEQAELLYRVVGRAPHGFALSAGMGGRHESSGVNVLLARIAAGRALEQWRLDGNVLIEKPFSSGRDAVDLITSVGVSRHVAPAVLLGVEVIGEDLEGFWDAEEAEGGARILIGPSFHIAPHQAHWQLTVAGGPILHATHNARSSDADRILPATTARNGYGVRTSLTYGF